MQRFRSPLFAGKHHSTETAQTVTNDIKLAMDSKKGTILVIIDLSSVFDTIDHSILLSRLELRYGITSVVFEWFRSYLYGRVQLINIDDSFSPPHPLTTGVPQGYLSHYMLMTLNSISRLSVIILWHHCIN